MAKNDSHQLNIQSNCIRGSYMRDTVDKTVDEIHDDIVTVFGPYAQDAYIIKDNNPYYTRDGMEVIHSMLFDNELSMYVLTMLYQAVYHQGKTVGDGTTTLAVFYTNLYKTIRAIQDNDPNGGTIPYIYTKLLNEVTRDIWDSSTKMLSDAIREQARPLNEDELLSLFYTCMQEPSLAAKMYNELKDSIMDQSYIVVNPSDNPDEFRMTTHKEPIIKCTKIFSIKPFDETAKTQDLCTVIHCNGVLDIGRVETLVQLMTRCPSFKKNVDGDPIPEPVTYIILCNGVNDHTRENCKKLNQIVKSNLEEDPNILDKISNVVIMTLDNYRSLDSDSIEDLSTMITDTVGLGSLVSPLTFETTLYQAMGATDVPDLISFDIDLGVLEQMRNLLTTFYAVQYDAKEGLRLLRPLGPVAQERYDKLREEIANEPSQVRKISLNKRLRKMYGNFIELEIGSKLIKDSQRKYELIVDAVVSSAEGVKDGVLHGNSIIIALQTANAVSIDLESRDVNDPHNLVISIIAMALIETIKDLVHNRPNYDPVMIALPDVYQAYVNDHGIESVYEYQQTLFKVLNNADPEKFNLRADNPKNVFNPSDKENVHKPAKFVDTNGDETLIPTNIIEPVNIITTLIENSSVMWELANAKTFHLKTFMQNYI